MDDRMKGIPGLPNVTHHDVTANGVRLHYVLAGEEMADPLVLLHGFPQSWLMWRLVLPALAGSHFVVAVDLRGYGDSEKPPRQSGHDQGTKASDVRALVQHLGLERIVMIGHDRGARVARRFALEYPDDLAGVALLDILPAEYVYDVRDAVEIEDCGHYLPEEQPRAVVEHLLRFADHCFEASRTGDWR